MVFDIVMDDQWPGPPGTDAWCVPLQYAVLHCAFGSFHTFFWLRVAVGVRTLQVHVRFGAAA